MDVYSEKSKARIRKWSVLLFATAVLLTFVDFISSASNITATSSGSWGSTSTWSCSCIPGSSDNITIPAGITVTTSGPVILFLGPVITITINGTLVLNNGGSLQVDQSDIIKIGSTGKIQATGFGSGGVYSGVYPFFISSGTAMSGPRKLTNGTLPVSILFFKGDLRDDQLVLTWASASEIKFDFYTVQRSRDGEAFETIAKITGAGTSSVWHDYTVTDENPLPGTSYYRLNAIDLDGSMMTFNLVKIEYSPLLSKAEIFPNPLYGNLLNARLNFYPEGGGVAIICNMNGDIVFQEPLNENKIDYAFSLSSAISSGIYFFRIQTKSGIIRTKLLIL